MGLAIKFLFAASSKIVVFTLCSSSQSQVDLSKSLRHAAYCLTSHKYSWQHYARPGVQY